MSRSRNDFGRCARCGVVVARCFCAALVPEATDLRIALVCHYKEHHKTSSTARLIAHCCAGTTVHDWRGRGAPFSGPRLDDDTWLLFPGGEASPEDLPAGAQVIVVDGAWKQVGKIVRFAPGLAALPRVSVAVTEAKGPLLRRRVRRGGMSSAEAIAALLEARDQERAAAGLRRGLAAQIEAILASKGLSVERRQRQLRHSSRGAGVATPSDDG